MFTKKIWPHLNNPTPSKPAPLFIAFFLVTKLASMSHAQSIVQPNLGAGTGSIAGSVIAGSTQAHGAYQYTLPFSFTRARYKQNIRIQPSYNSYRGLEELGLGWSLGVPKISLSQRTRYGKPIFVSSLSGELVEVSVGKFRPLVSESVVLYLFDGTTWIRKAHDGSSIVFGDSDNSKVGESPHTSEWLIAKELSQYCRLSEISSCTGMIHYTYQSPQTPSFWQYLPNGARRLSSVKYNYKEGTALTEILLHYRLNNPHATVQFQNGSLLWSDLLLTEIEQKHQGRQIRRMIFDYDLADNIPLLASVRTLGVSDKMELPKISLQYSQKLSAIPTPLSGLNKVASSGAIQTADISGDGIAELLATPEFGKNKLYTILKDNVGLQVIEEKNSINLEVKLDGVHGRLVDWDGDGVVDFLNASTNQVALNQGGSFSPPLPIKTPIALGYDNIYLMELNGDRNPDLIELQPGGTSKVYLHNGQDGWKTNFIPVKFPREFRLNSQRIFTDANNDGLTDLVSVGEPGMMNQLPWVMYAMGHGRIDRPAVFVPKSIQDWRSDTQGSADRKAIDLDQDGLIDFVLVKNNELIVWRNTGNQGLERSSVKTGINRVQSIVTLDVNQDGVQDPIVCSSAWDCEVFVSAGTKRGLLTEIRTSEGHWSRIKYTPISTFNTTSKTKTPIPLQVAFDIESSDGIINQDREIFVLRDFTFSPFFQSFLGATFVSSKKMTTSLLVRKQQKYSTWTKFEPGKPAAEKLIEQVKAGRLAQRVVSHQGPRASDLHKSMLTLTEKFVENTGVFTLGESIHLDQEIMGDGKLSKWQTHQHDELGQVLTTRSFGDGGYLHSQSNFERSLRSIADLLADTDSLHSEVTRSWVTDGSGKLLKSESNTFETQGLFRKLQQASLIDQTQNLWKTDHYKYADEQGLPGELSQIQDKDGRVVNAWRYDNEGLSVAEYTNAAEEKTWESYDNALGLLLQKIEPSGLTTSNRYDALGRLVQSQESNTAANTREVNHVYEFQDASSQQPRKHLETVLIDSKGNYRSRLIYRDLNNNEIQSYTEGPGGKIILSHHQIKDGFGNILYENIKEEIAHCSRILECKWMPATNLFPQIFTMGMSNGRPVKKLWTPMNHTEVFTYTIADEAGTPMLQTLHEDRNGNKKIQYSDVFGNSTGTDYLRHGDTAASYRYTFNPMGLNTHVISDGKTVRSYSYNSQGLITDTWDYQTGVSRMTYDDRGRLSSEVKNGIRTHKIEYDLAGRIVAEIWTEPSKSSVRNSMVFGKSGNSAGKMISLVSSKQGQQTLRQDFEHDGFGRISKMTSHLEGESWSIAYEHDNLNQLRRTSLGSLEISTDYDNLGWVSRVPGFIDRVEYETPSRPSAIVFSNQWQSRFSFDPQRGLMTDLVSPLGRETYSYDREANLLSRKFTASAHARLSSGIWNYFYGAGDSTYRIEGYEHKGKSKKWTYNKSGDRTDIEVLDLGINKNSLGEVESAQGLQKISWSANNEIETLSLINENIHLRTVALTRFRQIESSGKKILILDDLWSIIDGIPHGRVKLGNRTLGQVSANREKIFHINDRLGHPIAYGDEQGQIRRQVEWTPWGAIAETAGDTFQVGDISYAGATYFNQKGIYLMGARAYWADSSQFLSSDPLVNTQPSAFVADPLQANSYQFGRNNPLVYEDPDGHFAVYGAAVGFGIQATLEGYDLYTKSLTREITKRDIYGAVARTTVATALGAVGDFGDIAAYNVAKSAGQFATFASSKAATETIKASWTIATTMAQTMFNNYTKDSPLTDGLAVSLCVRIGLQKGADAIGSRLMNRANENLLTTQGVGKWAQLRLAVEGPTRRSYWSSSPWDLQKSFFAGAAEVSREAYLRMDSQKTDKKAAEK